MPDVDGLSPSVELDGCLSLFFEGIGARMLEATKGRLQSQAGSWLVDLHYTRFNAIGEGKGVQQNYGLRWSKR